MDLKDALAKRKLSEKHNLVDEDDPAVKALQQSLQQEKEKKDANK